jgi:hypothetical protein
MYARFVNHLEYIIREGLSTALVADIAQRQLADIFGLVTDDATAAGLSELTAANPAATSAMTARMDIADTMLFYTSWLEQRVRASLPRAAASSSRTDTVRPPLLAARISDAPRAQVPGTDRHRCCARAHCGRRLRRLHARRHPRVSACAAGSATRSARACRRRRTARHAAGFSMRSAGGG